MMFIVYVDYREYRPNAVKNLVAKGIKVGPKQLDIGGYVLSTRGGVER